MFRLQLIKKAIKLFPTTDYTSKDSVKHARLGWIKAQYYLKENNISPRALYKSRVNA